MRVQTVLAATLSIAMLGFAAQASAAPCKDAKGKFVKCPAAAPAPVRCKDAKGKFAKCGTPGATPISSAPASSAKPKT